MSSRPGVRELEDLERALAARALSATDVERHLHRDFVEFGKSGKVWTRDDVVAFVIADPPEMVAISDLEVVRLKDDLALITYRTVSGDDTRALRSSIWIFEEGRWQMRFHQGTLLARGSGSA
jgi:hypothetical protein